MAKPKGERDCKVKPSFAERSFPYEENELMSRYDGFWVLREGVERLAKLKATLEEENLGKKEMKKKLLAAKRLAHSKLKRELMRRQKQKLKQEKIKNAKSGNNVTNVKSLELKSRKKSKKSAVDSDMNGTLSKSETGSDEDSLKGSNIDFSPPDKKNMKKSKVKQTTKGSKRKFMKTDDCDLAQNQKNASQKQVKKEKLETDLEKDKVSCSAQKRVFVPLKFEENDFMTQFEGTWVKRTVVPQLNLQREEHLKHIYSTRENGDNDTELTIKEQNHYQRLMKKKLRVEYRRLKKTLINKGRKECPSEEDFEEDPFEYMLPVNIPS